MFSEKYYQAYKKAMKELCFYPCDRTKVSICLGECMYQIHYSWASLMAGWAIMGMKDINKIMTLMELTWPEMEKKVYHFTEDGVKTDLVADANAKAYYKRFRQDWKMEHLRKR